MNLTQFLIVNAIGIGSNLDNSGLGIAYGTESIRIPHWVNAVINTVGFFTALIGAILGKVIAHYLPVHVAAWAASGVLCAIGLFFWYSGYIRQPRRTGARLRVQQPGLKQAIVLGFALSFTNIASGFGSIVANPGVFWATVFSIALWGFVMTWLGNVIGIGILARLMGRYSAFLAGLLLIVVGLHQVV